MRTDDVDEHTTRKMTMTLMGKIKQQREGKSGDSKGKL